MPTITGHIVKKQWMTQTGYDVTVEWHHNTQCFHITKVMDTGTLEARTQSALIVLMDFPPLKSQFSEVAEWLKTRGR